MLASALFALVNVLAVSAAPVSSGSHQLVARAKLPSPILSTYINEFPQNGWDFDFGDWNVINIAFWLPERPDGAADGWVKLGDKQKETKKKLTNDGQRKLMLGLFGAGPKPASDGLDPVKLAQEAAKIAIDNNFDGVDVDWEDFVYWGSHSDDDTFNWLDKFQTELAAQLKGNGNDMIISHAPVAWWFTKEKAAWVQFNKKHAETIDFYNMQFYNGKHGYNTCEDNFTSKFGDDKDPSVAHLIEMGVSADKIVMGKQFDQQPQDLWSGDDLGKCVKRGADEFKTPIAGVMWWKTNITQAEFEVSTKWVSDFKTAAGY